MPQEGGGLAWSGLYPAGSKGTSGTNAPMKRRHAWRRQWPRKSDFASFWFIIYTCQTCKMHKNAKLTLLSSINHYNRSKSQTNSSLPDAYSMLHMHQQSFNPLVPELFLYLQSNRFPIFWDARHKWVNSNNNSTLTTISSAP